MRQKQVLVGYRLSQEEKGRQRTIFLKVLWKWTTPSKQQPSSIHSPPLPFLQVKDVSVNGEYSKKLLFLVGYFIIYWHGNYGNCWYSGRFCKLYCLYSDKILKTLQVLFYFSWENAY